MFQDFVVKQAIGFCAPALAGFLKPYLTVNAEKLLVEEAKVLVAKAPNADVVKYGTWAVDALAAAWGV